MPKFNKGVVIRTALFTLLMIPLVLNSCKNTANNDKKTGNSQAAAISSDSLNIQNLDKLIREKPKSPDLFAQRASLYAQRKNYTQALTDITIALKMDSTKPAYFVTQAEYYIFNGEPNSAKKALNACLSKYKDNTDAMLKLAEIHLYLKEYGQSKILLNQVLLINNDLAQIFFLQGLIALENNDTLGAIKSFQVTIEKEPDYYAAYIQAGKLYALKNNDLAIQYLKSAIDLQPTMYEAHYLLALYYQEHNYLAEAHQEYEYISTQIDSTAADPYYNRGYIEMVYKNNYSEAVKWFDKAISRDPANANAWYNRGFSNELDGKLTAAKSDYKKAMDLQSNFPLAIKGLNRIEDGKPLKRK
ncbi:MAG: tetratricopeptide repeat protein [Bacteroidales bacterium]|nr:tetratricopeptide repeat protein [Bacteroidales bacterium]